MLWLIALIVWIIAMFAWLFGGGYVNRSGETFNMGPFVCYSFIPWLCVLILGLFVFGAFGTPMAISPR